jgi:hypothetical protein
MSAHRNRPPQDCGDDVLCHLFRPISSKCWVDDQIRRKRQARQFQEDFKATAMERYQQFEATAPVMINALGLSLDERTKQMSQFYKDHPPPYVRLLKILPIFVIFASNLFCAHAPPH